VLCKVFAVFSEIKTLVGFIFAAHKPAICMRNALIFLLLALTKISVGARPFTLDFPSSHYVVIGAFAHPQNAQQFTRHAQKQWQAEYRLNANRNLYYVYVLKTGSKEEALQQAKQLRERSPYRDTWVYQGSLHDTGTAVHGTDLNPHTENAQGVHPQDETSDTQTQATPVPASREPQNQPVALPELKEEGAAARNFLFRIYRQGTDKALEGEVNVIDADTDKRKATYKGNRLVHVQPVNKSGNVALVCEVFGYRKLGHVLNLNEPGAGAAMREDDGVVEVPFEMIRIKKGDIQVLYQVFFFKDAAVMRPESRAEVNTLRDMLMENPNMKIRIHGHTNGNASGRIIKAGSSDFFSLGQSKETFGSAKTLSELRAATIKSFLVSEGIAAHRLEVKAWGGRKPIFDKLHSQAQSNVRVEIEVTAD